MTGRDLFGVPLGPAMLRTAELDGEMQEFRIELRRIWNEQRLLLVVCMLNPSKADHLEDDPTVLTLIHFAKRWGYGGLIIVNLHAFRSSSPAEMMAAADPIGPRNAEAIGRALDYAAEFGGHALAAWGNGGSCLGQDEVFVRAASERRVTLMCLGTTGSGAPKHPLARGKHKIPRTQQMIVWRKAA